MEGLKKVLNIIIDIFIVLVVIVSAFIAIISITARDSGVPNFFGYVPFTVQSNSMSPVFEAGDLIVGKRVTEDQEYKVGDVITYWTLIADENDINQSVLNTHRIVAIEPDSTGSVRFITKGDNNEVEDKTPTEASNAVALWSHENNDGIRIKKLGKVFSYLREPSGFFIAVVIPMIVFFIYELIRFITNFTNYNKEKSKEAALAAARELMGDDSSDSSGLSEDQKAQAILDYLEKQKAEKGGDALVANAPPGSEEAPAPAAEETAEPAAEQTASDAEQPVKNSDEAEETEQPVAEVSTEAVTEPEQDETVSESSED